MPEGSIERPLSPSLPSRDCGHECRVCKVTVASLTDYAGHISSPTHKQNVEAAEKNPAGNLHEDYFDQALVDLVEKRKEQIRKEKEAAAAKLAKEEGERKRAEEFNQRLKMAKDRSRWDCVWQQGSAAHGQHRSWYGGQFSNEGPSAWQGNPPGKSATWHAQDPPNFQRWGSSEDFSAGRRFQNQAGWQNRGTADQGGLLGPHQQNRLPWLSSGGSRHGLYGQNNICQLSQRSRPFGGSGSMLVPPPRPNFFSRGCNQFQNTACNERTQPGRGVQSGDSGRAAAPPAAATAAESDHGGSKSSKAFGSNQKLDRACRFSPYPVAKSSESHRDPLERSPKVSKAPETKRPPSGQAVEPKEKQRKEKRPKSRDGGGSSSSSSSRSSSRSSSAQREGHQSSAPDPPNQSAGKSALHRSKKTASLPGLTQLSKAPANPGVRQSGLASRDSPTRPLKSRQEPPEPAKKERVKEKRRSLDSRTDRSRNKEEEEKQRASDQGQTGVNKENSCRQKAEKPNSLSPDLRSSEGSAQFLQSLQVSTSTVDGSESVASSREEENQKKPEKGGTSSPAAPGEAQPASKAGPGSDSDTCRGAEAQAESGSGLAKLDLPPVLKRDLTKHMGSKSKAGGHEPNLNIARRVRTLSESRRSDSEKDSGLKPTVRQLISSSGSRRNVNWEQVYQEVRKKQDKGKGMPRFGIEMVPNEQEDQSQEEEDIPLIEGFQWDAFLSASAPGAARKRSLSESSIAPELPPSLFASLMSQRGTLSPEPQKSSVSTVFAHGSKDQDQRKREVDEAPAQVTVKTEKEEPEEPEEPVVVVEKVLQRSESVPRDSSSGVEPLDGQGAGKRRRTAGDSPSAEASCLEHNSKRQKIKTKKERLQIDRLLTVSLREEELSRSLQNVDRDLIQARATLEAAYVEVQRLMLAKQQVTSEMSALRSKRIDLLKGIQGNVEEALPFKLKEEKMDVMETDQVLAPSLLLSPVANAAVTAAAPTAPPPAPPPPPRRASPPSSSPSFSSVAIKEEPQSPVRVSSDPDPEHVDHKPIIAHSTTLEMPGGPVAAPPTVFLDGLKPKEELLDAVFQDVCQEMDGLKGKN